MKTIQTRRLNFINSTMKLIVIVAAVQQTIVQMAIAHEGHHTSQAWQSCEAKSLNENCEYVMQSNQLYQGSCQQMAQALMCVRNKPIVTLSKKELKNRIDKNVQETKSEDALSMTATHALK